MKKKVLKELLEYYKMMSELLGEQKDKWQKEALFRVDVIQELKDNESNKKAEIEKILSERMEVVLEEKEALKVENDEVLEKVELLAALADLQTRIIHSSNFEEMTKDESLSFSNLFYFVKRSILDIEY